MALSELEAECIRGFTTHQAEVWLQVQSQLLHKIRVLCNQMQVRFMVVLKTLSQAEVSTQGISSLRAPMSRAPATGPQDNGMMVSRMPRESNNLAVRTLSTHGLGSCWVMVGIDSC